MTKQSTQHTPKYITIKGATPVAPLFYFKYYENNNIQH